MKEPKLKELAEKEEPDSPREFQLDTLGDLSEAAIEAQNGDVAYVNDSNLQDESYAFIYDGRDECWVELCPTEARECQDTYVMVKERLQEVLGKFVGEAVVSKPQTPVQGVFWDEDEGETKEFRVEPDPVHRYDYPDEETLLNAERHNFLVLSCMPKPDNVNTKEQLEVWLSGFQKGLNITPSHNHLMYLIPKEHDFESAARSIEERLKDLVSNPENAVTINDLASEEIKVYNPDFM